MIIIPQATTKAALRWQIHARRGEIPPYGALDL
jgi:hypothetical protein